jgi:hypothetical protein
MKPSAMLRKLHLLQSADVYVLGTFMISRPKCDPTSLTWPASSVRLLQCSVRDDIPPVERRRVNVNQPQRERGFDKSVVSIRTAYVVFQLVTIYSHMTKRGHQFNGFLNRS